MPVPDLSPTEKGIALLIAQGTGETSFTVERYLPAMGCTMFAEAVWGAAAAAMTEQGVRVRYLGSVYVPKDECAFCCFEARTPRPCARRANAAARSGGWCGRRSSSNDAPAQAFCNVAQGRRGILEPLCLPDLDRD